jgi:hypothetical protein
MLLELLALAPLASAHFLLNWPPARGFDDDKAPTFPCGGFDTVSSNRTQFPLAGGPIQLDMHHTQTNLQVLLALGNGDGSYSIQLVPTFLETGPNNFCLGDVTIPSDLNLKEGDNATIQVVSNGDPDGGLYQVCKSAIRQEKQPKNALPALFFSSKSKFSKNSNPKAQNPNSNFFFASVRRHHLHLDAPLRRRVQGALHQLDRHHRRPHHPQGRCQRHHPQQPLRL